MYHYIANTQTVVKKFLSKGLIISVFGFRIHSSQKRPVFYLKMVKCLRLPFQMHPYIIREAGFKCNFSMKAFLVSTVIILMFHFFFWKKCACALVYLHLFNGQVWFPQNVCGNSNVINSTEIQRIPGNVFILPGLQRKSKDYNIIYTNNKHKERCSCTCSDSKDV